MILSPDDLIELTGKRRSAAQREVLAAMGIAYRVRPDGTLAVLRVVAELALGHNGHATAQNRPSSPRLRLPS